VNGQFHVLDALPLATPMNGTVWYYNLVEIATGIMVLFIPIYWGIVNSQVVSVVMIRVSADTI
jgi:hypothetical protein